MTIVETTPTASLQETRRTPSWIRRFIGYEEFGLGLLLAIVVIFFMIAAPSARESRVYFDLLREVSPNLIAVAGMTMLVVAGELDISIGAMLAFTGVVTVTVFNATGNMWVGIVAGLLTGPLIGLINGYLVTVQRMNSLVTTLGMMFALRGLVYVYTNKTPIVDENGFDSFQWLYHGNIGPVPVPALLALVIIVVLYFVMTQTEFGRSVYAIGGNITAARNSGIKVRRTKLILFVISATAAAISGLLLTAQTGTGYFDVGASGFELIVISSIVLGGVSLSGGQGRLIGAVLGTLILGMTGKGLRLLNVYTTWQLVVTGVVMMVAVYLHDLRRRLGGLRR